MNAGRIGRRVACWRERRGLTQTDFGRLMGQSRRWVQDLEGGQRQQDPRLSVVVKAAEVPRIPLGQLLTDAPSPAATLGRPPEEAAAVIDVLYSGAEDDTPPLPLDLASQGQSAAAVGFAVAAARRLQDDLSTAGPLGLSTLGMLYLSAAVSASAQERTASRVRAAIEHVDQAGEVADQQGADLNMDWTNFGPTNVALHRVDVLARFEDGWSALDAAEAVTDADVRKLRNERRAGHLVTLARAQLLARKREAAAASLVQAARLAPEEFRGRPGTMALVKDVLAATPVPSDELRTLAARCGLQA